MSGIALVIASALAVGLTALGLLLWALDSGQYDDLDGDAERILLDEDTLRHFVVRPLKANAEGINDQA